MSKSTISTFELFQMFPDAEAARVYIAELEAALSAANARAEAAERDSAKYRDYAAEKSNQYVQNLHELEMLKADFNDCNSERARHKAAREAAEAEAARLREAFREQRLKPGVRAVITAVHKRATEMGDQKCKAWLNSLGFELGLQLSRDRMDLSEAVEGSFTRAALGGEHG